MGSIQSASVKTETYPVDLHNSNFLRDAEGPQSLGELENWAWG